jgi:EF hand
MSDASSRKAALSASAVAVAALLGGAAFLLSERDYAGPQNPATTKAGPTKPPGEVRSRTEGTPAPKDSSRKPESAVTTGKPPHPKPDDSAVAKKHPPQKTVIIQAPGRGALVDHQSADTFIQFDTDRDGVVDRHEARYSDFLSVNFDAIDTGRDGKISSDEMRAFDLKTLR